MEKYLEKLRKAKEGDVIVILGRILHQDMYLNRKGELCPIIVAVDENDVKNEYIRFSFAIGYDDKNDKELRCWQCDGFEYGCAIYDVLEPTAKQYAAICKHLVPAASLWIDDEERKMMDKDVEIKKLRAEADYWKKEAELCENRKAEPKEVEADYSVQGIADYVAGAEDINELATIFSSAAFRLAYATDQFADSKERIVFDLDNKEYPLQVALIKEEEPLRIQTEFEHACFMEIHGLATKKQIAFRNYCAELIGYYAKHKSLSNFSNIANKYGVTGLTKDQFHKFRFDEPEWVEAQGTDYIDKIYEQIKVRKR